MEKKKQKQPGVAYQDWVKKEHPPKSTGLSFVKLLSVKFSFPVQDSSDLCLILSSINK